MPSNLRYAIFGAFVGAGLDILLNLIAAVLQLRLFDNQFSNQAIAWLIGLAVIGVLLGYWLGTKVLISPSPPPATERGPEGGTSPPTNPQPVSVTRLRALLSRFRFRGKGILLDDVSALGSEFDIDTRE